MNSFYILFYCVVYENDALFEMLEKQTVFTPQSFVDIPPMKSRTVENLLMSGIFYDYVYNRKGVFRIKRQSRFKNKTKFFWFKKNIMDNYFISDETKKGCEEIFGKVLRTYMGFSRLAFLWKWNRAKCPITSDLYFNELDIEKPYNFILYQDGVKFYFRINELLRTMKEKLISCDKSDFTIESLRPTNPYNKVELTKTHLYNIYFHVYFSKMKVPMFLQLYFNEGFQIDDFNIKHETYLRKLAIQEYVFTEPNTSIPLATSIKYMLKKNDHMCRIKIDDDFPKTKVVDAFRPYVYLEYLLLYGNLECTVEQYYDTILQTNLRLFYQKYPSFGRKVLKSVSRNMFNSSIKGRFVYDFCDEYHVLHSKHL